VANPPSLSPRQSPVGEIVEYALPVRSSRSVAWEVLPFFAWVGHEHDERAATEEGTAFYRVSYPVNVLRLVGLDVSFNAHMDTDLE
jgi:hypothetical protein